MAWAFMLIGAGVLFLLRNLDILHVTARLVWPLLLVGLGVLMLTRALSSHGLSVADGAWGAHHDLAESDNIVREWTTFGGVKRVVHSQDFQGGEVMSVFGGIELDLRTAQIIARDRPVVIDANTTFGGIEIRVPETWRVAVRGVGIFGGYEDKTLRARQVDPQGPLLVITGYAVFGGVVVES